MKVKDLIRCLQGFDPEDDVWIRDDDHMSFTQGWKPVEKFYSEASNLEPGTGKVLYTVYLE